MVLPSFLALFSPYLRSSLSSSLIVNSDSYSDPIDAQRRFLFRQPLRLVIAVVQVEEGGSGVLLLGRRCLRGGGEGEEGLLQKGGNENKKKERKKEGGVGGGGEGKDTRLGKRSLKAKQVNPISHPHPDPH